MKRSFAASGMMVLLIFSSLSMVQAALARPIFAAQEKTPLAAGPAEGFYTEIARGVADEVPAVDPVSTDGSVENLRLLEAGTVRFALAQQDVVSEHLRDRSAARGAEGTSEVRVVGRVFFEYLHLFVRSPLHVERANEFRRFRVWPGEEGSGTRATAVRFLESVGVPLTSLYERPVDLGPSSGPGSSAAPPSSAAGASTRPSSGDRLSELFRREELDVAMLVAMAGADTPCRLMESGRAELYPLDYQSLRLLTSETASTPFLRQVTIASIPADTYPFQEGSIPTVAVPVLLLARAGEDAATASRLLDATRRTWDRLAGTRGAAGCRRPEDLPTGGALGLANLEMLAGFEPSEPPLAERTSLLLGLLLVLGAAAGGWWLVRSGLLREIRTVFTHEKMAARILAALGFGVLLVTLLTYLFEHRLNEHFSTPWESAWSITIYLFSGLEDRNPYTLAGRVVATLGLILGPVFFALLTGWLAGVFIRWEKRMPQNLRDHVLLINWNERSLEITRELHHDVLSRQDGMAVVVVLTDDDELSVKKLKEKGIGSESTFEDFYVTVGDPTTERALLNANATDARSIVLLVDDSRPGQADERSIRTLVMLRRLARRHGNSKLHVVVELADGANEAVLEEMAEGFPGLLEWVSGIRARTCLLAQAAVSQGVTGFYGDLLRVSSDTNEVYTVPVPESAVGTRFREYAGRILGGNHSQPFIPVGVQRGEGARRRIFTNPRSGEPGEVLERNDMLVLLAYDPPGPEDLPA